MSITTHNTCEATLFECLLFDGEKFEHLINDIQHLVIAYMCDKHIQAQLETMLPTIRQAKNILYRMSSVLTYKDNINTAEEVAPHRYWCFGRKDVSFTRRTVTRAGRGSILKLFRVGLVAGMYARSPPTSDTDDISYSTAGCIMILKLADAKYDLSKVDKSVPSVIGPNIVALSENAQFPRPNTAYRVHHTVYRVYHVLYLPTEEVWNPKSATQGVECKK